MSQMTPEAPVQDVAEEILTVLHEQPRPATVPQLLKALLKEFDLDAERLSQILADLVSAGRAYKFQPYRGGGDRYWDRDKHEYARAVIRERLDEQELSKKALWKSVQNELRDCQQRDVWSICDELVKEGLVDELPKRPRSSTVWYSSQPPQPEKYISNACNDIIKQSKRLARYGVKPQDVYDAVVRLLDDELSLPTVEAPAPQPDAAPQTDAAPQAGETQPAAETASPEEIVLQRLRDIELGDGGVTFSELRGALDFLDIGDVRLQEIIEQLQREGKVRQLPPRSPEELDERLTTRLPQRAPVRPTAAELQASVLDIFNELLRERHARTGMIPIHEIRSEIARRHGEEEATHQTLDPVIRALRDEGYRLAPISNTQDATDEQLQASIPGMHETLFYLELGQ